MGLAMWWAQPEQQTSQTPTTAWSPSSKDAPQPSQADGLSLPKTSPPTASMDEDDSSKSQTSPSPSASSGSGERQGADAGSTIETKNDVRTLGPSGSSQAVDAATEEGPSVKNSVDAELRLKLNAREICAGSLCRGRVLGSGDGIYELVSSAGHSNMLAVGERFSLRFDAPGRYHIQLFHRQEPMASTWVEVSAMPQAAFEAEVDNDGQLRLLNQSQKGDRYRWRTADHAMEGFQPTWRYRDTGSYTVQLVAASGGDIAACRDTVTRRVHYARRPFECPNIITPNGDGPNDLLQLDLPPNCALISLRVIERGRVIFETQDADQGWDGRYRDGRPVPQGVYHYLVKYRDAGGHIHALPPVSLTLVR